MCNVEECENSTKMFDLVVNVYMVRLYVCSIENCHVLTFCDLNWHRSFELIQTNIQMT